MKKFLSALLVVLMALSMLAGCANNNAADNQASDPTDAPVVIDAPAEEPTAEPFCNLDAALRGKMRQELKKSSGSWA